MTVLKVVEYTQYSAVIVVGSKRSQAYVFQRYSFIVKRSSYVDNSILQIQYLEKTNQTIVLRAAQESISLQDRAQVHTITL